ncbi:MAG: hypothetical protein DMG05_06075 [Acidobacteria bacterium]|nr:MAG: hypothetical protein DMG05_06075 [Acidobacteriota bacterium]
MNLLKTAPQLSNPTANDSLRFKNHDWGVTLLLYAFLTLIMWGLFAFDRGPWQDEAIGFYGALVRAGKPLNQLFMPIPTPTRPLCFLPFTLAHWLHMPILIPQLFFGAAWLSTGVLTNMLIRRLFPQHPPLALTAGAVALSASGDLTFDYTGAVGPYLSVALYLGATVAFLKWWQEGSRPALVWTAICLLSSVWMYDAALAAVLVTPALLWLVGGSRWSHRLARAALFWYGLATPYLLALFHFVWKGELYAAVALRPMTLPDRLIRTSSLFLHNFTPWVWALKRRQWFPSPEPVLSPQFRLLLATFGAAGLLATFVWIWRRQKEQSARIRWPGGFVAFCMAAAFGSNAIYASVQFSELHWRTQLVSGVWVSVIVSLLGFWIGGIVQKPLVGAMLPLIFCAFGLYGGLERQDYYLGYWRRHQTELRSIVEQVPSLAPDANLVLYVPPGAPYLLTEATYLAHAWLSYVYGDPTVARRIFLWSEDRKTGCKIQGDFLACKSEPEQPPNLRYPIAKTVLLAYDPADNRYMLENHFPAALAISDGASPAAVRTYTPLANIQNRPLSAYSCSLVNGTELLARFFPPRRPLEIESKGAFRLLPVSGLQDMVLVPESQATFASTGIHPAIKFQVGQPAMQIPLIRVQVQIQSLPGESQSTRHQASLYFRRTNQRDFSWDQRLDFDIISDGQLHSAFINPQDLPSWNGTVAEFQLGPLQHLSPEAEAALKLLHVSVGIGLVSSVGVTTHYWHEWVPSAIQVRPVTPGSSPVEDSGLLGSITSSDPNLSLTMNQQMLSADSVEEAVLQIKGQKIGGLARILSGSLYFKPYQDPMDEVHSFKFSWIANGKTFQVRIPLGENPFWRGPISVIRLDPVDDNITPIPKPFEFRLESLHFLQNGRFVYSTL